MILSYLEAFKEITAASSDLSQALLPFLAARKEPAMIKQSVEGLNAMIEMVELAVGSGGLTGQDATSARGACVRARQAAVEAEAFITVIEARSNG